MGTTGEDRAEGRSAIRRLNDLTISRIAAGEVVERPASVVKELLENSIDAGASAIRIEIRGGGQRRIKVADDGSGIPSDEVELAFARHATSKVDDEHDLVHIDTLGFRGEALAAIAAVAHVTLVTRRAGEDVGVRIRLDNGDLVDRRATGAPAGTTVTVENLFHGVPARRKFLKTESTESGHVTRLVTRYALAYPGLRLDLERDGRSVLQTTGSGDLRDVLAVVFDAEIAREMVALDVAEESGRVHGLVGPPHVHRSNRQGITLFVNGRWVQDHRLVHAITKAYHALIPSGRYPLAVLMITVPPDRVDVNVHPTKTEVRFRDHGGMYRLVQRAVRRAVTEGASVAPARPARPGPPRSMWSPLPEGARPRSGGRLNDDDGGYGTDLDGREHADRAAAGSTGGDGPRRARSGLPPLRLIGQVMSSFVLAEGPEGLYLIDQHAAHERVMYERFMARDRRPAAQRLLSAETITVSELQMGALEHHGPSLEALGFEIEPFGTDRIVVRALPEVVARPDVKGIVREVLDALIDDQHVVERTEEERLVRAVCKRATIKAGQALSREEMQRLLMDLEAADAPHSCPHGRPTMIVVDRDELARQFGRT